MLKGLAYALVWFSFICPNVSAGALPEDALYAFKIVDLSNDTVVAEHNASMPMTPASTLKTLTFYLALKQLGSGFHFNTEALYFQEALYLKLAGDPTLRAVDLEALIDIALTQVRGKVKKIYLDGDMFGIEPHAPGVGVDNLKFAFAAGTTGYILDHGFVSLKKSAHQPYYIADSAYGRLLKISFDARVSMEERCELELGGAGYNKYQIYGCYNAAAAPDVLKVAISDQSHYMREAVLLMAKKRGISHVGIAHTPVAAKPLALHQSKPIEKLLQEMMAKSNNQIANALVKTMAYRHYKAPVSWSMLERFIKEALPLELSSHSNVRIVDGAGLSHHNKVHADFMMTLLKCIYQEPEQQEIFLNIAANNRVNGESTFAGRLEEISHAIYAKTGSLNYTSGLVGMIAGPQSPQTPRYGFIILTNNNMSDSKGMKQVEEEWLKSHLKGMVN
jgi:D-alanyl-D-alanine carboxypeptidase/D-alanyl-D-alanine-endopeptidase (penicillin-binding protein 4)